MSGPTLPPARTAWIPVLLLGFSALLVVGLGYAAYRFQAGILERQAHEQLVYVASEKADRIEGWLQDRAGDAQVTARDPLFMDQLRALGLGTHPGPGPERRLDPRLLARLDQRLQGLQEAYRYSSVHLLGPGGQPLVSTDGTALLPWEAQGIAVGEAAGRPRFIWEVQNLAGQGPRLHLASIVTIQDGTSGQRLGTLVFRLDPWAVVTGWLGAWPTSSPSGETLLLAEREGRGLFLNRTRRPGAPVISESLTRLDLVGIQGLVAGDGLKWGKDYQDRPSVAVARRLRGIPWVLLAKVDQDEYLLPVRRLVWIYSGLGLLFLAVTLVCLMVWFRRERARERVELARLEAEIRAQDADRISALNDQLEQRVLERTAQLETAFREMEAFSYSVSHDLRGPLRGIDGFSLAILEDYGQLLDDQGRHFLGRIRHGVQRMGQIMDDLLDLSRLSRQELARSAVDLSAQAREILAGLAQQEPAPRQVQLVIQDGLGVEADPRLMRMVLGQLLNNAWKFTGKRPQARIEFGALETEPGMAGFFVRDNGAGFDMAYAAKLFGAFQRLHDPAEFQGTGIGLAIAQRILRRHGGRVWAEAVVDQGATFYFALPA